ncbi:DUF2357 domain-containing protein [Lachnospiraceae bacterium SGI.054]
MRISIITPSGKTQLELKSQPVKLRSPFALLEVQLDSGEQCDLSVGKKVISYNSGVNQFHLDLSPKNSETVKVVGGGTVCIFQISCSGGIQIDDRSIENLIYFCNSLSILPASKTGQIHVSDLLQAIDTGKITLLRVQKPLTGYDNKSLFEKLESALTQKVRAICSSPKQGIRSEELVQDVSLVKRINTDTLSYLSSHTEHWKARTLNGLIPKRLKADIIEDEINIYENLFFKMAIDDIADFTTRQILSIKEAKRTNQNAKDWEAYGDKINDRGRRAILQKLLFVNDSSELSNQNKIFDDTLKRWMSVSKILVSIRSSAFYRKIDGKKRISKTIHLTNILKNDQRYKALYDVWCLIQKEKQKEQQEKKGISSDLTSNVENYYATYSGIALLYSMNLLGIVFSDESTFAVDAHGKLRIYATAYDGRFTYTVKSQDNEYGFNRFSVDIEECVDISVNVPEECNLNEEMFSGLENIATFDLVENKLHFHKKPESNEITLLRELLHKPQSEVRRMPKTEKYIYQKANDAWNLFFDEVASSPELHDPRSRRLYISPVLFEVQADSAIIEKFTDELFSTKDEYVCYLLPNTFERYKDLKNQDLLHRLLNYGESFGASDCEEWKNYKISVLPVTQIDIGSIQRLMKYVSIHRSILTMELESSDPVHCPVCGSKHIQQLDTNSWKCANSDCGIEWGETRCTKGCKEYFYWIRPGSELPKNEFDCNSECELILKKDSLFDRYVITDFEFETTASGALKAYPVCPKCGTRRF